jgi:hypothetical protein
MRLIFPPFRSEDTDMYLVLSPFTPRLTYLVEANKGSVFLFRVLIFAK